MIIKKCFFEWLGIIIMIITGSLFINSCTKDNNGDDEDDGTKESTLKGRFAFVSYDDGDGEIYTVNADGTNLQNNDSPDTERLLIIYLKMATLL